MGPVCSLHKFRMSGLGLIFSLQAPLTLAALVTTYRITQHRTVNYYNLLFDTALQATHCFGYLQ